MELNYFQFGIYSLKVGRTMPHLSLKYLQWSSLHSLKDLGKDKTKWGLKLSSPKTKPPSPKPSSPAEFMVSLSIQNFIPFLALLPSGLASIKEKRD